MLPTIQELRRPLNDLRLQPCDDFSYKTLKRYQDVGCLDFDVILPTRAINLQRPFVWTLEQKREFILSIVKNPSYIPRVAFLMKPSKSEDPTSCLDTIQVIDGKQRVLSFMSFIEGEYSLVYKGEEYTFNDLPDDWQRSIKTFTMKAFVCYEPLNRPLTDNQKIAWFTLINFAGTPQEREHLDLLNQKVQS